MADSDIARLRTTLQSLGEPSTSMERVFSPTADDTSDGLSAEEDMEWKKASRLKRIEVRKSYAKLSPSDLALLKHDGVKLPSKGKRAKDTAAIDDRDKAEKKDYEISTDVRNVLEDLMGTTCNSATEITEQWNLSDVPPVASPQNEQESATLQVEMDLRKKAKDEEETMGVTEYLIPQSNKAKLESEVLDEAAARQTQEELQPASSPLPESVSDTKVVEEFVSLDSGFVAAESLSEANNFNVEHVFVHKEVEKCSLTVMAPPRKKRKRQKSGQEFTVDYNTSVVTESGKIVEYLRNEDTYDSGFSEATFLEQCYVQSPDLFGIGDSLRKRKRKEGVSKLDRQHTMEKASRETTSELALVPAGDIPSRKYTFLQSDVKTVLDRLWRREEPNICQGRFGALVELCRSKVMDLNIGMIRIDQGFLAAETVAIVASRPRSHLISDFKLTMIKPVNPVVRCEADMGPLMASLHPVSPLRLSLPRVEGSLENAFSQYDKGVVCILEQVSGARTIIENIRSTTHWSLHFLMDAQLFVLDVLYELWEYTARSVQLAVFNAYQCSLWEKHHQIFDARMYCLLFEMNAAAALSSKIETCCSYIRRFEEWNRKTNNLSSVYNHVYGLALSMIRLIAIPNALKRVQAMTQLNSKTSH
ncbi:hypothetical protein COOONC_27724 [Cooperia oncophora]